MRKLAEHPSRSIGFLSRYHDRELAAGERLAFERHASACAECAAAVAEYEAILSMYRASAIEPSDPALAARISRRIDAELRHRPAVRFLSYRIDLLWASVVAIALVASIALFAVLGRREPRPVPVVVAEREPVASPRPAAAPAPELSGPERRSAPAGPANRPVFAPEPETESARDREPPGGKEEAPGVEGGIEGGAPASPARPIAQGAPAPPAAEIGASAPAPLAKSAPRASSEMPLRIGWRVAAPVLTHRSEPVLPDAVRKSLATSPVVVEAVISADGAVVSTRIVRSNPAADRAVLDALRQWTYRPAVLDGKPVAVYLTVVFRGE